MSTANRPGQPTGRPPAHIVASPEVLPAAPWRVGGDELADLLALAGAVEGTVVRVCGVRAPDGEGIAAAIDSIGARQAPSGAPADLELVCDELRAVASWPLDRAARVVSVDVPGPGAGAGERSPLLAMSAAVRRLYVLHPTMAEITPGRLVVSAHPRWQGLLHATLVATRDIADLVVAPDVELDGVLDVHHAPGPLYAGQQRALDLVPHPGALPARGITGDVLVGDGDTLLEGAALRVTLLRSRTVACAVASDDTPAGQRTLPVADLDRLAARRHRGLVPAWWAARVVRRWEQRGHGDARDWGGWRT